MFFKNKSKNLEQKNNKIISYNVIDDTNNLDDIKFDNFEFPFSYKNRLKKKDKFHFLYEENKLICFGWSSSRNNFLISEINKKIENSGNLIFYDFKTLLNFRKKGYYQALLREMLNKNKDKNCYIYSTVSNKRSIFSILKSGFKLFKFILFFGEDLRLR